METGVVVHSCVSATLQRLYGPGRAEPDGVEQTRALALAIRALLEPETAPESLAGRPGEAVLSTDSMAVTVT